MFERGELDFIRERCLGMGEKEEWVERRENEREIFEKMDRWKREKVI